MTDQPERPNPVAEIRDRMNTPTGRGGLSGSLVLHRHARPDDLRWAQGSGGWPRLYLHGSNHTVPIEIEIRETGSKTTTTEGND